MASSPEQRNRDTAALLAIAAAIGLLHIATNGRYGVHRDELQVLSDARHLDWGFVAYPPLVPAVERLSLHLFGLSLNSLRLFSVVAQCTAIVVAGLMAREFGGHRLAQVAAAVSVALTRFTLFQGTQFEYSSFDFFCWVLASYFLVRLAYSRNPRWWLAIAATLGLGLQTKYTIVFLIAGICAGLLLTDSRRLLRSRWFWIAAALTILIALPNLLWQAGHEFISYHFLRFIHARDVGMGRAHGFLREQFTLCANPVAAPLWIAGLVAFVRKPRLRLFAWMYLLPLALLFVLQARAYYLAGAYPLLLAMGAVSAEHWTTTLTPPIRNTLTVVFFLGISAWGAAWISVLIPLAATGPLRDFALAHNGELREEIGWDSLVRTVAGIRDSLPPAERQRFGVVTGNYGEQGAIEILGPRYHLPPPISPINSAWLRRYPVPPPATLIVLGFSREDAEHSFSDCRLVARNTNPEGIRNDEGITYPDIFLCGSPRLPWPQFWAARQTFQ